jgi:hypothetical protein
MTNLVDVWLYASSEAASESGGLVLLGLALIAIASAARRAKTERRTHTLRPTRVLADAAGLTPRTTASEGQSLRRAATL